MDEKQRVTRAAGQISIATTMSRILGFIRDILLAKIFGATGMTDAFFIAYRIPNLLRELFAEGSMSAAFVPVFTETLTKEGADEAKRLASSSLTFLITILIIVCLLGMVFTPYIVAVIAPGFLSSPEKFSLTVKLARVMFPFLLFISLAALLKGILNSLRSFFVPALAPVFLNLSIISAALFLAHRFSVPLMAIALAVSVGGALQFLIQVPDLIKRGFFFIPGYFYIHPGLKKILKLLIPAILGMGVAQINIFVSTVFVSFLPGGAATYLYYAMRFIHLPIGIFGVAMATAILPSLSEYASRGDISSLRDTFSFSLRTLFFITIPAMAGLMALSVPVVELLLERGEFTHLATLETAYALVCYATGLWAFVGVRVVTSAFYSMQDTKTPVKIASLSILANIVFSFILMGPLRHGGLALANAIASGINFVILFLLLRKKIGRVDGRKIFSSFLKISSASIIMALSGHYLIQLMKWDVYDGILERSVILLLTIMICIGLYLGLMSIMKSDELKFVVNLIKNRRGTG